MNTSFFIQVAAVGDCIVPDRKDVVPKFLGGFHDTVSAWIPTILATIGGSNDYRRLVRFWKIQAHILDGQQSQYPSDFGDMRSLDMRLYHVGIQLFNFHLLGIVTLGLWIMVSVVLTLVIVVVVTAAVVKVFSFVLLMAVVVTVVFAISIVR